MLEDLMKFITMFRIVSGVIIILGILLERHFQEK